jgi:hypothetical protein
MIRLLWGLVMAMIIVGCTSDEDRIDRINVEGVDCIVTRNSLGKITFADCDWAGER